MTAPPTSLGALSAAVTSYGRAWGKRLLVNGIGMTVLPPATKYMVHLPMAFHRGKPESALIICFGMGTSFRSALTWDVPTTVVELVPSVPKAFPFYHADAGQVYGIAVGNTFPYISLEGGALTNFATTVTPDCAPNDRCTTSSPTFASSFNFQDLYFQGKAPPTGKSSSLIHWTKRLLQ